MVAIFADPSGRGPTICFPDTCLTPIPGDKFSPIPYPESILISASNEMGVRKVHHIKLGEARELRIRDVDQASTFIIRDDGSVSVLKQDCRTESDAKWAVATLYGTIVPATVIFIAEDERIWMAFRLTPLSVRRLPVKNVTLLDSNGITTLPMLTPQQEQEKQDSNKLVSSIPANEQRSIKALALQMSEQLVSRPISEADVRRIMTVNFGKIAEITHPRTAEMLQSHAKSLLFYGILDQIELMNAKEKISEIQEIIAVLREEVIILKDHIKDWPDPSSLKTITYKFAVQLSDGSWTLKENTQAMEKVEVINVINQLEIQIYKMVSELETLKLEIQNALNQLTQNYQAVTNILQMMYGDAEVAIRNLRP